MFQCHHQLSRNGEISPEKACTIHCIGSDSCNDLKHHWTAGANNTLLCNYNSCYLTDYPSPVDDNTPYAIICDYERSLGCYGTIFHCPQNASCNIICHTDSCPFSGINCPETALCNISCLSTTVCWGTTVKWSQDPDSSPSLSTLDCPDGGTQCDAMKESAIIQPLNNTDNDNSESFICDGNKECMGSIMECAPDKNCSIYCIESGRVCTSSVIYCSIEGNCEVHCDGFETCMEATFHGPSDGNFTTFCNGKSTCWCTFIYAQNSNYLDLTIGTDGE